MAAKKQCKRWCFTVNNFTKDEWLSILDKVTDKVVKYAVIGEETADSGTVHLQGYVRFKTSQRLTSVKKYVGRRAHVEACRGSEEENKLYCTKDGKILLEVGVYNTSVGMRGCPSSMGDDVKALIDFLVSGKTVAEIEPEYYLTYVRYGNMISKLVNAKIAAAKLEEIKTSYDNVTWRNWQRDTISDVDGPIHDRQVQWIWDAKGGQGKTFLSKYLVSRGDCVRFENGKSADIKYGYTGQRCVIFDLSRSQMDHINYEIIESVKNGIIYNTKYQCEMRVYKIPHVIVFSNEMPSINRADIIIFAPYGLRTRNVRTHFRTTVVSYHSKSYPMKYGKRKYRRRRSFGKYKRRRIVRRSTYLRRGKYTRRFRRRHRGYSINKVFKEVSITQRTTYNYSLFGDGQWVFHNFSARWEDVSDQIYIYIYTRSIRSTAKLEHWKQQ